MGMLTGKEILLLDLYSFQRWPDVRAAFDRFGSYTPSWSAARRQAVADDGDTDWWNAISPAYRWMMGEMERKGMPCPNPDAAPLWAWARWVDSKGEAHTRPDRRYSGFRDQYVGLELLHLRVDERRVLCTDFRPVSLRDQQLAVRPVGCRHMAARRVRPVAGRALGRPARREGRPVPAERDRGSETAA